MPVNVLLKDIIAYGGKRSRPLIEGEKLFKANHIISVAAIKRVGRNVDILGLVIQSSQPKARPHEVSLELVEGDPSKWKCVCTCKAGLGHKCKHVFGLLVHLNQ